MKVSFLKFSKISKFYSEICISYTDTKVTTAERQEALYSIYRFKSKETPVCQKTGEVLDQIKMKDSDGKVLTPKDHAIKAAGTALSDMGEFKERGEYQLMFDTAQGWLKRKMLPDTNM